MVPAAAVWITSAAAQLPSPSTMASTRESIASQAVVCLAGFVEEGKLDSYEKPLCSQSGEDPSVCVVQVAFRIAHVIHQIVVDAKIQI